MSTQIYTNVIFILTNVDETDTGGVCMCVLTGRRKKGVILKMYSWTARVCVCAHWQVRKGCDTEDVFMDCTCVCVCSLAGEKRV